MSLTFIFAVTINIPADQPSIQAGINAATNTDTILVQSGTYVENINFNGKNITVASLFLTTQDTTYISSTIIDGNSNGSVVTFNSGEDSTSVLTGFTITNGSTDWGGGICCSSPSSPILENLTISDNSADYGGGIFYSCNPNLQDVTISNNYGNSGSGIYCWDNSSPSLKNVIISGNHGDYTIGCYNNSNPIFENNTISDNSYGGPLGYCIVCFMNCSPVLINSILWNDSIVEIYFDYLNYPEDPNSITISYSDIQGGESGILNNNGTVNWLEGNIDSDPLFVNPSIGNYHLQPTSPCIDAGDPASPLDPDGSITDMGAYCFQYFLPDAEFAIDITQGYSPLMVDFTDLSTQGTGAIDEWYWDFGDGTNSSLQDPSIEYLLPGIYTVSLTVTDVNDSIDTETKVDYITVYGNDPPAPPANVQINISGDDAIITWSAVDTTIYGDPCVPDGYVVYYNEMPDEEHFWFLA